MALTAADFDVRGAVEHIDPGTLVYDARQLASAPPSPLPFDLASLTISAPPSPLPFDLASLNISAPPSPLPFDLSALSIAEPARPSNETLIAVINAIDAADYDTLERFAAAGYDFNSCAASRNELGASPLNRIVHQFPQRGKRFDVKATHALIRWLCAHGARPTQPDSYFRQDMWTVLHRQIQTLQYEALKCSSTDMDNIRLKNYQKLLDRLIMSDI